MASPLPVPYAKLIQQLELCAHELHRLRAETDTPQDDEWLHSLEDAYRRMGQALASVGVRGPPCSPPGDGAGPR